MTATDQQYRCADCGEWFVVRVLARDHEAAHRAADVQANRRTP